MHKPYAFLAALALAAGLASPQAAAQSRDEQASARQEMQAGRTMPLREIERRVVPQMKGREYLGPEYDATAGVYRLKFIDNAKGQVIWVDVDSRTAKILRISK